MTKFAKQARPALVCLLIMVLLCGVVYTAVVTGIAQLAFAGKANGSMVTVALNNGETRQYGSALIAQQFTQPQYLIGRPMQVSNLAPNSAEQEKLVQQRVDWWREFDPANTAPIPVDLLTASGSGVDPNISPAAAQYQVARIANVRGISEDAVQQVISKYTSGRFLGFIGEEAVNVLQVNLALDGLI